jgi:hypothetical protein
VYRTATREPHLIINPDDGKSDSQKHLVGISGGLWNAVAVTLASNFATLYEACIEAGRVYARLCSLTVVRSRAMEDRPGIWGWAVVDVSVDELDETLEKSQNAMVCFLIA